MTLGAVGSAYFPLFGKLLIDFLPVKEIVGIQPAHVTLVLRLNIDADTALARKPEHGRALVERKIAVTPQLRFGGARIADIDATMDYAEERALARRLIDQVVGAA